MTFALSIVEPDLKARANAILRERHYLGPTTRGEAFVSDLGVLVIANPTSRNLPQHRWCELVRWCITGGPNAGSRQWTEWAERARREREWTTVVSYSDPSVGHDGALYRASGWLWAPTWHRLRPPPQARASGPRVRSKRSRIAGSTCFVQMTSASACLLLRTSRSCGAFRGSATRSQHGDVGGRFS